MLKFFDFAQILFHLTFLAERDTFTVKTACAVFPIFFAVVLQEICQIAVPAIDPNAQRVVNAAGAPANATHEDA